MSRYLPPVEDRFAATVRELLRRVKALEARTVRVNAQETLHTRYGTVNPGYTSGDPQVTVDGDTGLTGPYPYLRPYEPAPSDRVVLVPVGTSYAVAGTGTGGSGIGGSPGLAGQAGGVNGTFPGGTNSLAVVVTFPAAFPAPPAAVFASGPLLDLVGPAIAIGPPSTTQFTFVAQRRDGANVSAGTRTFYWLAVA